MHCPTCNKRLPESVRFCAYCGTALALRPWRKWLSALTVPSVARPAAQLGAAGAALGAVLGSLMGQLVGGAAEAALWLSGLAGAAGLGVASAWGHSLAAQHMDRDGARRFGQVYGGLGGAVAGLGGFLAALAIAWQAAWPEGFEAAASITADSALAGLRTALVGGFLGAVTGILAGRFASRVGFLMLRRRGAVLGGALAWTLGGLVGAVFAGHQTAGLFGRDPAQGALLAMLIQVGLSGVLLTQLPRLARGWRAARRAARARP